MKKYAYILTLFILLFQPLIGLPSKRFASPPGAEIRKNKILVLIIASDDEHDHQNKGKFGQKKNNKTYSKQQQIWRSYMHLDPEHVEAYFIKANPNLPTHCEIHDDVIWTKTEENWIPGLTNKTLASLEIMKPRFHEFDYVLRANLSSFYIFPRLLEFIQTLPMHDCYCGIKLSTCKACDNYVSGAGILLSMDLATALVSWKNEMWNSEIIDDCCFGLFLSRVTTTIIPTPRIWVRNLEQWDNIKHTLPIDNFHFRVKHENDSLRETEEIAIQLELLEIYYGIHLDLE